MCEHLQNQIHGLVHEIDDIKRSAEVSNAEFAGQIASIDARIGRLHHILAQISDRIDKLQES